MTTVGNLAKYLRSKNAGPFWLTVDCFCNSIDDTKKIADAFAREKKWIASVFNVKEEEILVFNLPSIQVAKISFPRRPIQGNRFERDMHGGQQYVTLLDIEV